MFSYAAVKLAVVSLVVISLLVLYVDNTFIPFFVETSFEDIKTDLYEHKLPNTQQTFALPPPLTPDEYVVENTRNYSGVLFDNCTLPHLNPWDPTIKKFLEPDVKPEPCKHAMRQFTKLENGTLYATLHGDHVTCAYRCLYPINDYDLKYGSWINITITATPNCDIVETKCFDSYRLSYRPFYEFMHAQVYRSDPVKSEEKYTSPDVYVIIIDSVSHSSFVRALPRTYYELMANYEAIQFPHLNKVAINSRPNALAMLFGKSNRNIEKSPVSAGYSADIQNDTDCHEPLDDEQWIGKRFNAAGYTTMMNDDWALGPMNWPGCKGFVKKATDHIMKPYQLRVRGKNYAYGRLRKNVYRSSCRESFEPLMDYLNDFIAAYPEKPKFAITWIVDLAHNSNNNLHHADNYFFEFFRKNEVKFNNSFVFVLGDHGMRFGDIVSTPVGHIEETNPFLLLSLPWSLRRDAQTSSTVRQNALQLITHYDLYATFVDIARPISGANFSKIVLHGSSLLRPLPQPRTCDRLRVPFEYCSCLLTKTKLPSNDTYGKVAASKMINQMNQVIRTEPNIKDICALLELNSNETILVEKFEHEGNLTLYQVTFSVQPGDGRFWGYVGREGVSDDVKILSKRFPRLNSYDRTATCATHSAFAAYCYCKSLLKR